MTCPDSMREAEGRARAAQAVVIAQAFHEAYERLAQEFGYQTRPESAVPWEEVPENNRRLMVAVCAEIIDDVREGIRQGFEVLFHDLRDVVAERDALRERLRRALAYRESQEGLPPGTLTSKIDEPS